jgi:hypothetical protein
MGTVIALGVFFLLMGLVGMGASVATVLAARRQAASRIAAWGVVVALRPVAGRRGYIQAPVVQFQAQSGEEVTFASSTGAQPPIHTVGQRVAVFYPSGSPHEAEIEAPAVLWLVPAGIFAIGFLFAAMGAVLVLVGVMAMPAR